LVVPEQRFGIISYDHLFLSNSQDAASTDNRRVDPVIGAWRDSRSGTGRNGKRNPKAATEKDSSRANAAKEEHDTSANERDQQPTNDPDT
jgi:hypothetical protein